MTENTEYILCATRFSVPLPKGRVADPTDYERAFNGMVSGIKVDPKTGEMKVGWQILTPPFDWDLGSTGKGPSSGWAFWTSYNTEMAHDTLEVNSTQKDRDLAAVVNWRAADKAVAVPVNTGIEVTFDQDLTTGVAEHFSIEPKVAGRFEQHGRVWSFIPTAPLAASTIYAVKVAKGVAVTGSDGVLESDVTFRFETSAPGPAVSKVAFGRSVMTNWTVICAASLSAV